MQLTRYDIECLHVAKELILKDITRHYTIQEIAEHARVSPTKLKSGFKKIFGVGLFEYLEIERLEKSKEMMADQDKSLKLISKALGFKYQNNFSKAFKKRYGMSPASWRNTIHTIFIFIDYLLQLFLKLISLFEV